jgi:hypothetical protein
VKNDKTDRLQGITDRPEPHGDEASFQDPGDQPRTHRRTSRKAAKSDPLFDGGVGDQPGMDHPKPSPGTPPRIFAVAEDAPPIVTHPTLSERADDLTLLGALVDTVAGRLTNGHFCPQCLAGVVALASHHTWKTEH